MRSLLSITSQTFSMGDKSGFFVLIKPHEAVHYLVEKLVFDASGGKEKELDFTRYRCNVGQLACME